MSRFRRVIICVLDSLGMGAMPDAERFGDAGSDTFGHVAASRALNLPCLQALGVGNIRPLDHIPAARPAQACYGKCTLASQGKDTTSGHWEMMGLILDKPFPTYIKNGFPAKVIREFERAIGRRTLGNYAASGTKIIAELGEQHLETGRPIVYTSADSVFQVAAHEEVIPLEDLYQICRKARKLLKGKHEVGRVIARPFVGRPGHFVRTEARRDFAVLPFISTVLDRLTDSGMAIVSVGKVAAVFGYRGTGKELKAANNAQTAEKTLEALANLDHGLIFTNFVDFDMLYGHRNDVEGYARALEGFDQFLGEMLDRLSPSDLLILTSDHGCDPSTASTDHSREYALLLSCGPSLKGDVNLGTRSSLADIGATVAENFGIEAPAGASFLPELA